MKDSYKKRIDLDGLTGVEIDHLQEALRELGLKGQYKFNHYGIRVELIVTSKKLHRLMRTIRKTTYKKTTYKKNKNG